MENIIDQAISNVAITIEALEKYCKDTSITNISSRAYLLELMTWELHTIASRLAATQSEYDGI